MSLVLLALAAVAASEPAPPPSDAWLSNQLARGETLETRADGDLNGDGRPDVAFVGSNDDRRTLYIALAYRSPTDIGHDPAGNGPLNPDPTGHPDLSITRGILKVSLQTGGTTQWATDYRLRWDAAVRKMRLIGLDTMVYSRTYGHDGSKTSWNLLTGAKTQQTLKLVPGGGGYADGRTIMSKRASKPVYIDKLPDPSDQF